VSETKPSIKELIFQNIGEASMCWSEIPSGIFDSSRAEKLGDEIYEAYKKLRLELEFTRKYLDPADTSFRSMMDTFATLPPDKKDKLIDLARSLARLAEPVEKAGQGE